MKKQHLLFLSLFLSFWSYGAIIQIQNNTKTAIDAGIKYGKKNEPGEKRKSEIIKPGHRAFFNSWLEEIHAIYWKEGNNKWKISAEITALTIGKKYILYHDGHYDTHEEENLKAKKLHKKQYEQPEIIPVPKEKTSEPSQKIKKTHRRKSRSKNKQKQEIMKPATHHKTYKEHIASKHKMLAMGENSPWQREALAEELKRRAPGNTPQSDQEAEEKRRRLEEVQEEEAESDAAEAAWGE